MRQAGIQLVADEAGNFYNILLHSLIPTLYALQRPQFIFVDYETIILQQTDNLQALAVNFIKQHTVAQNTVRQQLTTVVNQLIIIVTIRLCQCFRQ